jgi:eukaryotic-like serine/threonine-protein kinase
MGDHSDRGFPRQTGSRFFIQAAEAYADVGSMGESGHFEPLGGSADPTLWARACDIFHAAVALDPAARAAFVESACRDDDALRREVRSLLASDLKAGNFIERPAAALLAGGVNRSRTPRLAPGTALGRYEILGFLGAGGLSQVYRARDSRLGRTVALKVITDPNDGEAGSRLLAEAQHASLLSHAHICGVYEAENDATLPFIVLELVEGSTLSDVLKARRPSIDETVRWGKQIAAALEHAHGRGVIHRDLKSANVAFSSDGVVKVLDFGLSRRVTTTELVPQTPAAILTNASVAGTLTHIAPEVLRGAPLDQRVDLWALGVVLYELTTGVLPFKRPTPLETADAILDATPEPLPADVPVGLRRVIERCLAKDPALRYSTAAELSAGLDAVRVEAAGWRSVGRHLAVAALVIAVGTAGWFAGGPVPVTRTPAIAILPLENASADITQAFFADGVTEELAAALGRIDGLRVIASSTSSRRTDSSKALREVARDAGADGVLEGSISKVGNDIRLAARLTDAATGRVLWEEQYQGDARRVHTLHVAIANAVAKAVQIDVSTEDAKHFATVRAVDPDVYEAYLKGRFYWNQRTAASLRTAVEYFETALKLDPTYAPAYASLADCYNLLGTVMVGGGSPRQWRPKAMDAAVKALQIDADLSEAHATLGYVRHYDWQWEEAEKSLRRAIALNPNNALARIWYANLLCSLRRFDEAIDQVLVARDLDPLSLIVSSNVGWVYFRARRNEEAIAEFERGLALDSTYLQSHMRLADSYFAAGLVDEAIAEGETVARLSNGNVADLILLEKLKLRAGRPNEFDRRLEELVALNAKGYASPGAIANAFFAAGRNDEGFVWLERAYAERSNNMVYLSVEPSYDSVRDDPRFRALLRAVGLP